MSEFNQIEYINQWTRENTKRITIKLNVKNDADVIARLDRMYSKAGYIKSLIRADIEREKNNEV